LVKTTAIGSLLDARKRVVDGPIVSVLPNCLTVVIARDRGGNGKRPVMSVGSRGRVLRLSGTWRMPRFVMKVHRGNAELRVSIAGLEYIPELRLCPKQNVS